MNKVIVIGCPGSGKSTFSIALNKKTNIPLYHLDMLYWKKDKSTVEREVFLQRLNEILSLDRWIIDGNYQSTMEKRIIECDTVIFLDYPVEICLEGIKNRRGKPRCDIPWIEKIDQIDNEFLEFIKNYNTQNKPLVIELLKKYSNKEIFVFKSRKEAEEYLNSL